jgi:hypothetical protein
MAEPMVFKASKWSHSRLIVTANDSAQNRGFFTSDANEIKFGGNSMDSRSVDLMHRQGDQIGRFFAYWAIVYFGRFIATFSPR